jgi:hypothetical protein
MLDQAMTDSWVFFKRHLSILAAIVLPVVIPLQLVFALYVTPDAEQGVNLVNTFFIMLLGFIFYALYMPAVVFYIASAVAGYKRSITELYQLALKWWGHFVLLLVLVMLSIGAGTVALIIPGIIIMLKLAFAEYDMLLNGSKPIEAMKTSWRMTKSCKGTLFGGYLIITLGIYVPFVIVSSVLELYNVTHWAVEASLAVVMAVCNLLYTIFAFRVYELVLNEERETMTQEPEPSQSA